MVDATSVQACGGIDVAIVGMAGRFPGANSVDALWRNIMDGIESVSVFSDEQLREHGVSQSLLDDPGYVKSGVKFDGFDQFDASFFGYSPREAEQLDPQHRLLLECAWEAIESAGYDVSHIRFPVGIYAGAGPNLYLMRHLLPRLDWERGSGIAELMGLMNGNAMGALCTQVAYKLNLRGPAVTLHTACSTSLVAVHVACQSLLGQECDMALAGGVWLNLLQDKGYLHQPGAILSSDGHCRAFDAEADGTALGSGVGIVVLKRLDDALRDRDFIHAVIKGTAANNDGTNKVGYTAPSVEAQAEVIETAQLVAGVEADSIGYVEAHGTGTTLGDPIEVAALTQAFRKSTTQSGYCALGSVKTNIGHLDAAAGVTGLIKTALALRDGVLPPSLNYSKPNTQIDFEHSPFYVNTQLTTWPAGAAQRRAGVSSFGIGGTNVHAVLEAPPESDAAPAAIHLEDWQVLPVSATNTSALKDVVEQLAEHLQSHPAQALSDVAHTLQIGRQAMPYRAAVVVKNRAGAVEALKQLGSVRGNSVPDTAPEVVFLFPGAGSQHAGMGAALYGAFPAFRQEVDRCLDFLRRECDLDLRPQIFPAAAGEDEANRTLSRMEFGQTAQFVISYATARLWMSLGVKPAAMLGHSLGEYVAACVAGVFSLEDALRVVVERARLQQRQGLGAMTSVLLSEAELKPFLGDGCELAVINGEQMSVLSGPVDRVEAVEQMLVAQGHVPRRLHVAVAAHSAMTEPIMGALESLVAGVQRQAPQIPFVSNVSGRLIAADEAMSPAYWAKHLRSTVRFLDGLNTLLAMPGRVVLEVGSSDALTSVARQHGMASAAAAILSSQAHARQYAQNAQHFAGAAAGLWIAGVPVDWSALAGGQRRRRVPLPTYPFQRRRYWIEPGAPARGERATGLAGRSVAESLYVPVWKRAALKVRPALARVDDGCVVLLAGVLGLPAVLAEALRVKGHRLVIVERGARFEKAASDRFTLPAADRDSLLALLRSVEGEVGPIGSIIHLWSLDADGTQVAESEELERGFFSLLACAQAMEALYGNGSERQVSLAVVTNQLEDVLGDETLHAAKATLPGLAKVIGQEYPQVLTRVVDVQLPAAGSREEAALCERLIAELQGTPEEPVVAYRHGHRWIKGFEAVQQDATARPRLREQGIYLITGGLGGVGLALAKHLAQHWRARLVLVGRTPLPERAAWAELAADSRQPGALRYRLQQLLDLEAMGASVLAVHADVADAARLREVVAEAHRRFGSIQGVVHAAGDPGSGMLSSRTRAAVEGVFASKVRGTRALLEAIADEPLDFLLFCSSISSVAGGLGMGDYAAANAYLDAVAIALRRESSYPVFSVNWDAWRGLGMAAGMEVPDGVGWDAEEGAKAFEHIVCGPDAPHIVVCTTDLATRLGPLDSGLLEAIETAAPEVSGEAQPRPSLETEYVAPTSESEHKLAAIWTERLGIAPIGIHDNLYELGGNSLLAIQILARVRAELHHSVQPSEFFRNLTIAGLAGLIGQKAAAGRQTDAGAALLPVSRDQVLRLAPTQRRVWVFDRLAGSNGAARAAYNETVVFELSGELDHAVMQAVIDHLIGRHEVLRTAYPEDDDGEPIAVIAERIEVPVERFDLNGVPEEAVSAAFAEIRARIAGTPFDMARGPLVRAALVRLAERRHRLIVTIHHIIFDGWSTAVFTKEFCEIYRALRDGREPSLAPLAIQYADYAVWHDKLLHAGQADAKAFWNRYLQGAPRQSVFPADRPRPKVSRHDGDVWHFDLGLALSERLTKLARDWDVSVFALLLSAYLLVLHRRAGVEDVVVGTDVAGRGHPELEDLIGFFVNVVPVRSRLAAPDTPLYQWARQVHENVAEVFDHQSLPLDQIMTAAQIARGQGVSPLLQMLFVMQNTPKRRFDIDGLEVDVLPTGAVPSKFDMAAFVHETDEGLSVDWVFAAELYDRVNVAAVATAWQDALAAIVAGPEASIGSLQIQTGSGGLIMNTPIASKPNKLDMLKSLTLAKAATPSGNDSQIRISYPSPGRQFPVLIEALDRDLDPVWWASQQRDFIEDKLRTHAGIVFRNFGLSTPQDFERFTEAMEPKLYGSYGDLPKKEGGVNTYRSTPYPEKQMILYHNECSHTDRWPRKQWFFCELPSRVGGITPIVDGRELLDHLPTEIVEEMERKGLLYVRNFHPKLDVSWQHFFKTEDRAEVEARLQRGGIEWVWLDGDILQTRTRAPAVITHPVTGARAFFNQVQLHHVSCLEPEVRSDLLGMVGLDLMPRHVFFGDGSPISDATMEIIGAGYEACAVRLDWQRGDVVMLDNMLAAHARDPYEEPRKIVVAMGSMYERDAAGRIRSVAP